MLCHECNQREAVVYLTKIVNGQKTEMNLCEVCANEKGDMDFSFKPKSSLQNFLASFLNESGYAPVEKKATSPTKLQCSTCGLTFAQFRQVGRFGCSDCYHSFGDENLQPLFRRMHGSISHVGKVPQSIGGATKINRDISELREKLQELIQQEEYEKAAEIRDKIRSLEQELEEKGEEVNGEE